MTALPAARALFHIACADLLERVRRFSFLVVLASAVFAGYLFVPPVDAGYRVLQIGTQRGIYNSAWIGLMFGLIAALHLPLAGFYVVKNAVERDRQTGVGQIIAATPTRNLTYVLGKWLSNLAVLALILGVMTAMAVVMQLLRAEDTTIRLGALVAPIWLMGLPVLALAAALAVLFECISFLRGGLGNVAFFFLWLFSLVAVLAGSLDEATGAVQPGADPFFFSWPLSSIQQQVLAADPEASVSSGLILTGPDIDSTFVWEGVRWNVGAVLERLGWLGLAFLLALASAVPFDRFDLSRRRPKSERSPLPSAPDATSLASMPRQGIARLTPLPESARRGRFGALLVAELKLMLKGQSGLWYLGVLGLNLACLLNPSAAVQRYLLLVLWLWPLALWSKLGARERLFNTEQMVYSAPHLPWRQVPALWLAGVAVALIATLGGSLSLAVRAEMAGLMGWFVGLLFVPALALALGVWVRASRAFEALYLLLWYLGPVEGVPALDYLGATADGLALPVLAGYLAMTAGLVVLAMLGRRRRIQPA